MPPKNKNGNERKRQRVRMTNKGLEAQQFSTVRPSHLSGAASLPANSATSNPQQLQNILTEHKSTAASASSSASAVFDPITNDSTFVVVERSAYWPPPSLEELQESTGVKISGDGFDTYDRREEEAVPRKEKTAAMKIKGELQHPRGKPRINKIEKLDTSSDDEDEAKK